MKKTICILVLASFCISSFTGCATLFKGSESTVKLINAPSDVTVTTKDGAEVPVSNGTIKLKSKNDYTLVLKYAGTQRTIQVSGSLGAGWLILDILGGLIPVIIDAATGNWFGFDDISVSVK